MSPSRPRVGRRSAWLAATLCAVAQPLAAQPLTQLVPTDAYSMMYAAHDPGMAFAEESGTRVWNAIREAKLHEVVIGVLEANAVPSDDIEQVEALVDLVSTLVGNVAWSDLVANEMVYAEVAQPALPGLPPGVWSYLGAFRPDIAKVPDLERSLVGLLEGAANLTDEFELKQEVRPSDPPTRVYGLVVGGSLPVAQLAVRGDVILAGFGSGAFHQALMLLDGSSEDRLVDTPRYLAAVGEVPEQASQFVYFDVERMIDALIDQVAPMALAASGDDWRVSSGIDDLRELLDFVDTSVTAVHAEGRTLVSECWTRYDPAAAENGNPVFASFARPAEVSELLDYVPADAVSFAVCGGCDLRPLYQWALGRVKTYVPDAGDALIAYDGAQALLDISVEHDLLSWIGSESVSMTLPARRPRPGGSEDWISITRLRDPDGARKLIDRCESVYTAVVPPLLKRLDAELTSQHGRGAVMPRIEMRPADGSFSSLRRVSISFSIPDSPFPIPPIPDLLVGVVGNLLVVSTSEDALLYVMDVAAGEADGVWDHPAMTEGRLPVGAATACQFAPIGKNLQELTAGLGVASGMLTMVLGTVAQDEPEVAHVAKLVGEIMPKVLSILQAFDFLEDEVSYSQSRDGGLTSYSRSSLRYKDADR